MSVLSRLAALFIAALAAAAACNAPPSTVLDLGAVDAAAPDMAADLPTPDSRIPDLAPPDLGAPDAAGPPFGPNNKGAYIMGSSYAMEIQDFIKTFTAESGLTAKVGEWTMGGAAMDVIWSQTLATNPTLLAAKLKELRSGDYGLLFMNAQQPWIQTDSEIRGVGNFTEEALKGNAAYRFMIQVYWRTEQEPYRFSETSTRAQDLAMYRRGALRVAHDVAAYIKAPVFVAPVGVAVEAVKDLAVAGKLSAFKTRAALHEPDGQHLSALGHYVQALVVHTAAYQDTPHGHSLRLGVGSGSPALTPADAKLIWDAVLKAVREAPFSGWYKAAPADAAKQLAALSAAISNWETFDNLKAASSPGNGVFTGEDGFTWTFSQGTEATTPNGLVGRTLGLSKSGGALAATIPGGVGELSFVFSKALASGSDAVIEVRVGGKKVGAYTRGAANTSTLYATRITGIDTKGPVKVELLCKGDSLLVDDVMWTDYP